jgi:predicted ATPase
VNRLYRLLLHLYPAEFRGEYGADMLDDFARSDAKLAALLDVLPSAAREHADVLRQDLRDALRSLRVALALGIGANTVMPASSPFRFPVWWC